MITQVQNRSKVNNVNAVKLHNAESYLWVILNNKKLKGRRFKRHYSLGEFKVDFYCESDKIALILDGEESYTDFNRESDFDRNNYLKSQDIKLIQIDKNIVINNSKDVIEMIIKAFDN